MSTPTPLSRENRMKEIRAYADGSINYSVRGFRADIVFLLSELASAKAEGRREGIEEAANELRDNGEKEGFRMAARFIRSLLTDTPTPKDATL